MEIVLDFEPDLVSRRYPLLHTPQFLKSLVRYIVIAKDFRGRYWQSVIQFLGLLFFLVCLSCDVPIL